MQTAAQLLIFSRYPTPGQTKTRLIPALGAEGAAELQRRMTEAIVDITTTPANREFLKVTVSYNGASQRKFRRWLGPAIQLREQADGDLGRRMRDAFEILFQQQGSPVIGIGSDIPSITPESLEQARLLLDNHDVVLGPAVDGGYYLIGMNSLQPELFTDIDWGTEQVYRQTRERCSALGLKVSELAPLADIDRPEDLALLAGDSRFRDLLEKRPSLSIVIPTLNEAASLPRTLERLQSAPQVEIIVADGGSTDGTDEIARHYAAKLVTSHNGRADQLNLGAAASGNRYLLFLHADTLVPIDYLERLPDALGDPETVMAAFRFKTDAAGPTMRIVEWGTNLRSSLLQLPYGDQGLFMEKRVFDQVGGFPDQPIMEDFELVRKLRRRGKIVTLKQPVQTSGRRWKKLGILRTTMINQLMIAGFLCGVSPAKLQRIYRGRALHRDKAEPLQ